MQKFFGVTSILFFCVTVFMIFASDSQSEVSLENNYIYFSLYSHYNEETDFENKFYDHTNSAEIISAEAPLFAFIRYPIFNSLEIDSAVSYWANSEYANALNRASLMRLNDDEAYGEINIEYDLYITDNRFIGVLLQSTTIFTDMDEPEVVSHTFNFDLEYDIIIEDEDSINLDNYEEIEFDEKDEIFIGQNGALIRASIDPSRPMVALTFDDGPSVHTLSILDTLEKYGALATFFVVGELVERHPEIAIQTFNFGHEILGHSWTHRSFTALSDVEVRNEIVLTNEIIEQITGISPSMTRTPFGHVNARVQNIAAETGVVIIGWSVDPRDWQTRNADRIYADIMSAVYDRAIILCHDLRLPTAKAMEMVIPSLIERGYQLVTVSELMYFTDQQLVPGQVIRSGR